MVRVAPTAHDHDVVLVAPYTASFPEEGRQPHAEGPTLDRHAVAIRPRHPAIRGSRTVKVEPSPGRLCTSMRPW